MWENDTPGFAAYEWLWIIPLVLASYCFIMMFIRDTSGWAVDCTGVYHSQNSYAAKSQAIADIARLRYADGVISHEDFQRIVRDLGSK